MGNRDLHANNITGNLDTTISPTATNELRLGYSHVIALLGVPDTVNYNAQLGIKGLPPGLGAANDTGLTLFSPSNYAQVGTQNFWPNTNNFGIYPDQRYVFQSAGNSRHEVRRPAHAGI